MSLYTSIKEGKEATTVDFFMEIGMDSANAFFKNATPQDVADAIEAQEDRWPPAKLRELASKLHNLTSDNAVHAVRSSRTKNRHKRGHKPVDIGWEPLWFARTHSLAKTAATMCEARQHKSQRKLDGVACGQCWETAIRNDQTSDRQI